MANLLFKAIHLPLAGKTPAERKEQAALLEA